MSDRDKAQGTSRCPSSSSFKGKRHEKDPLDCTAKRRKASGEELGHLSSLISGLIEKLDKSAGPQVSPGHNANFSGFHDISSLEDEAVTAPDCPSQRSVSDPLDYLDMFLACQPQGDPVADVAFRKALKEFAGHFHGEEELGDPLSERLASILNLSLRRRLSSDSVK
ncbi:hypothetical protein E2C01_043720 [Portunus trituberculatus]|uniref:Uncharacterized protein n=1 Tax=Portunus trituberculatus TaxID=210409 RepID=A0A5B7FX49_PORTR|nr:hypothetical protein [Portunus trituberculatus]